MNVGIISTSAIVPWFVESLKSYPTVCIKAIYSRNADKAKPVAEQYHIDTIYTDLEEMLSDPELDTIYLTSPNSLHYSQTKQALLHGKNVINEKPFAATLSQAEELFEIAEEKDVRLFDMSISREYDRYLFIKEHMAELGKIRLFKDNQSQYSRRYDAFAAGETPNVFNPEMEGGALMDLNVYNIALTVLLFGKPEQVFYVANVERGIDTTGELILKYPEMLAETCTSKSTSSQNMILVQGEKGFLSMEKPSRGNGGCKYVKLNNGEKQEFDLPLSIQNMERIVKCVDEGDASVYEREKEVVLAIVDILEKARHCAGIVFPSDR